MKKIIFMLLLLVGVFGFVNVSNTHAYAQDTNPPFQDKTLLVSTTQDKFSNMYFLISAYEYSKMIPWSFVDFYNGKNYINWDYDYYTDYNTTITTLKTAGVITEYNYPIDGLYYYIDLVLATSTVGFGTGSTWAGNVMGAIVHSGTYNSYNINGVVLNNGHILTGPAKTGYTIADIAFMIVNNQTRYYEDTIDNLNIEEIEAATWREGVIHGAEYSFNNGYEFFGLGLENENSYAYKLGNEKGQTTGFNGFTLILGFIFSAFGAFGNIEIIPGLKLWYVVGIIIVFGLIGFITSRGKRG